MEKTATHNDNYITMLLEDVGMQYSLPVMLHAFPVVQRENAAVNSKDHNRRCGDAILTRCYVPFIPSSVERKHSSQYQGSLTMHTPLEHEVKKGTHWLRWEEGENSNT